MTQTFTWLLTGLIILSLITVVAGLISMRCKEIDHERTHHSAADYRFYQRDLLQPFQRRLRPMSYGNIFTMWKYGLRPDQIRDLQRWYGEVVNTPAVDAEIGMCINGIGWDYSFAAIDNQLVPLRRGFVPIVSRLAMAITDTELSHTGFVDRMIAGTLPVKVSPVPGFDKVKIQTGPVSIVTGKSSVSFRPGKALVGQDVAPSWDILDASDNVVTAFSRACAPDVDKFIEQVLLNRGDSSVGYLPHSWLNRQPESSEIADWRNKLLGTNLAASTSPEPAKSREEIMRDLEHCQKAIAEVLEVERRRNLTNGQIMQLCAYFRLYSFGEIIQFIEDHKR